MHDDAQAKALRLRLYVLCSECARLIDLAEGNRPQRDVAGADLLRHAAEEHDAWLEMLGINERGLRKLPSPAVQRFNSLRKGQLFLREKSCITKRFRLRRVFLELPEVLLQCEVQPEELHLAQTFQLGSKFV